MNKPDKEISLPETLAVYTFLHGKNALERVDAVLNPKTSLYHTPASGGIAFSLPNSKMAEFRHILLFEGFTMEGAMNGRVIDIEYVSDENTNYYTAESERGVTAKRDSRGDLCIDKVYELRHEREGNIIQQIPRHLVAVPKGNERFMLVVFDKDSLRPIFKFVRSTKDGFVIETANSY